MSPSSLPVQAVEEIQGQVQELSALFDNIAEATGSTSKADQVALDVADLLKSGGVNCIIATAGLLRGLVDQVETITTERVIYAKRKGCPVC